MNQVSNFADFSSFLGALRLGGEDRSQNPFSSERSQGLLWKWLEKRSQEPKNEAGRELHPKVLPPSRSSRPSRLIPILPVNFSQSRLIPLHPSRQFYPTKPGKIRPNPSESDQWELFVTSLRGSKIKPGQAQSRHARVKQSLVTPLKIAFLTKRTHFYSGNPK